MRQLASSSRDRIGLVFLAASSYAADRRGRFGAPAELSAPDVLTGTGGPGAARCFAVNDAVLSADSGFVPASNNVCGGEQLQIQLRP